MPEAALVLTVDTATPAVTAAVIAVAPGAGRAGAGPVGSGPGWAAGLRPLAAEVAVDARRHGELLAPGIEAALRGAGHRAGELTAVVAGLGPGPYTGLRVGLVTAAAFADALRIPVYGVCSLDAVALPVAAQAGAGRLLVATDARRREVYWALYDRTGARLGDPGVDRPAGLAEHLAAAGGRVTAMCGAGARLYADQLGLPLLDADHPAPVALAALARDRVLAGAPTEPLVPLYLRRPDAVEPGRPKAVTPA